MYVILELGGRQYRVEKGARIRVNRLNVSPKKTVKINKILFAKEGKGYRVGNPYIRDGYVICEVISELRAKKVIAFKYKRRKSQKRKVGHRQDLTELVVKEIHV